MELKDKKNDPEYEEWFLRYRPSDKEKKITNKSITNKNKKRKTKKTKKRGLFF